MIDSSSSGTADDGSGNDEMGRQGSGRYMTGASHQEVADLVDALEARVLVESIRVVYGAPDEVEAFRTRRLDADPYTFLAADALVMKVREGGRVANVHAMLAVGIDADGHHQILGPQTSSAEDGAGWLGFFRDLTDRGLSGVRLVTSDAHASLIAAIGATLPGASWQRCRTHYVANLMIVTPKTS